MTEVQGSRQFNYSLRQLQLACPTTSLIDNVPMKLAEKQRVRRFTPKTRTGCLTCKRRRVKCDERKPTCAACDKVRAKCEGYAVPKAWIFEPSGSSTSPASSAESNTELCETKRHAAKRDFGNPLHVLEPILYPNLFNHEGEPAVIMQAYLDLSSDCPMAWDTSLYRTRSLNADPVVDETGALSLNNQPLDPTPLRRQSHLALAAAMLCFCRPGRFPRRLYLTYMQSTVAEIRYQIVKSKFSVDDLLSGISQTLLACILQCDVEPTITHLRAAAGLVESCGGIDKIDPNIAAVLRYSDFHFALECLLAPVFPLMMDLREQHETRLSVDNGELAGVGEAIKKSAKTLPRTMELVVRRFVNCALALAQCLTGAQKSNSSLEYKDLNFMAAHLSGTLHILLGVYPSALSMGSTFREQAPLTESYTVCMIMWCQLLICCANETLTNVGIRMNLLPVRSHSFRNRCTFSSPTINKGLTKWNTAIYEARSNADDNAEDWLSMVDIVEEMENDLPVQISPLMRGLLAIPRRAP